MGLGILLIPSTILRLANGSVALPTSRNILRDNDYGVVNGYSLGWYEVIIPSESTNTGFESALIRALWEGAEFTGRYVLPIEDALIMIDGKDFDGVERNRVAAAGFFLVGLVPGGKITKAFKPLAKVVKGSEWYKIIKDGTNYVVKTIKVIPTAVMNILRRTVLLVLNNT